MFDRKLWTLAKKYASSLSLTILLGAITGVLVAVQARLVSAVIAGVFLDGQRLGDVKPDLFILLLLIMLRAVAVFGGEVSSGKLAVRVKSELREKLFSHLLNLGPAALEGERTGELSNTLVQGIEHLDAYFRQYLPQLALSALVPLTILVVVFPIDWITGVIFLVTAPLIPLFMVLIGQQAEKETERQWRLLSRLSAHFLDILQGLTTLKRFGRSKQQAGTIRQVSDGYAHATLRVLRIAFLSALVLEILATISTAIVAVQIGLRLLYAKMAFVDALFVLILAPEFYFPLRQLGASFHAGMEGISAAGRIFELMQRPVFRGGSKKEIDLEGGIVFEKVSYAYADGERPSLHEVDFSIPAGKTTALVGVSGAGKTTIAKLLLGFIQPDQGRILVGGQELGQLDLAAWRRQVAWVSQFPIMLNTRIEENFRLAKPEATQEEILDAARLSNADGFIEALPQGYQTVVGEGAARLSGGQAQRIALARAFLKDASLVILDEPGANLDQGNLALLQQALDKMLLGRTAVIIAHRLSTIRSADQVIVLDKGMLSQVGDPNELLAETGIYRELVQAANGGLQ